MRKNSFGQGLAIFFVIIGVLFVIGSIGEASEPKCIKAGCDNKQASGSSYCYLHKPYTGVHRIAVHHIAINHPAVLLRVVQVALVQAVVTIVNQIQQRIHHIVAAQRKAQRQRRVHMTFMMMAMMISIWMAIMTMIDMTETAIMLMV